MEIAYVEVDLVFIADSLFEGGLSPGIPAPSLGMRQSGRAFQFKL